MIFDITSGIKNVLTMVVPKIPIIGPIIMFFASFGSWILHTWTGKIAIVIIPILALISLDLFLPTFLLGILLTISLHFYLLPTLHISLNFLITFAISLGISGIIVILIWKKKEAMLFIVLLIALIALLFIGGFL